MIYALLSLLWLLAGYGCFALGAYRGFLTGRDVGHERGYRLAREHEHSRRARGVVA